GYQVWTQRFDRRMADVFSIQDEIAEQVAEALELRLLPADRCRVQQAGTSNSEAYDLYLKAWSYFHRWGGRNVNYAAELFQHALDRDPGYARAWAGLADAYAMLYIYTEAKPAYRRKAREASKRAVKLCPKLPEAHTSRGLSCSMYANWPEAEQHFESALRIDPEHFEALYFYARACVHQGKEEQAVRLFERATQARPEDYQAPLLMQQLYKRLGRGDAAIAAAEDGIAKARRHLKMNPDDVRALYLMSGPLADLGRLQEGEQALLRAMAIDPTDSAVLYNAACFYARIGDQDRAIELLESVRLPEMAADWVRNDPDLALLRGHPRFDALYPVTG
ncbi:MAG: tetratricopeptide repeat protein, partial [Gammaproteobacteria bacterium]|nr:tetratricopeptide repeat protein [Gammaproteobacteria bacterium]